LRGRRKTRKSDDDGRPGRRGENKFGALLLELRDALEKAARCRRELQDRGFPKRRWLEIVRDVDPHLRFMVRPQLLDSILIFLEDAGEPVNRESLVTELNAQEAGPRERVRQVIDQSVKSGKLVLHPDNKIGLPDKPQPQ
jgi:hypothetical protein